MIAKMLALRERRLELVARSALERANLAATFSPLYGKLRTADRIATSLRSHPVAAAIAGAGAFLFDARALLRWGTRVAVLYPLLRSAARRL
ncbi:MAG: hypothetical protein JF611_09070 [Betaproteobacteria bacterium]|nr:hypothetical protein [Betaproteobacteria bacterium]